MELKSAGVYLVFYDLKVLFFGRLGIYSVLFFDEMSIQYHLNLKNWGKFEEKLHRNFLIDVVFGMIIIATLLRQKSWSKLPKLEHFSLYIQKDEWRECDMTLKDYPLKHELPLLDLYPC